MALAECSLVGGHGFKGESWAAQGRLDAALFGETTSRVVVSIEPGRAGELAGLAAREGVPIKKLGAVGGQRFSLPDLLDLTFSELERAWRGGLEAALSPSGTVEVRRG